MLAWKSGYRTPFPHHNINVIQTRSLHCNKINECRHLFPAPSPVATTRAVADRSAAAASSRLEIGVGGHMQSSIDSLLHWRPSVHTLFDSMTATIASSTAACFSADSPATATSRAWTSPTLTTQMNEGITKVDLAGRRGLDDFVGHFGTECPALRKSIEFLQLFCLPLKQYLGRVVANQSRIIDRTGMLQAH